MKAIKALLIELKNSEKRSIRIRAALEALGYKPKRAKRKKRTK